MNKPDTTGWSAENAERKKKHWDRLGTKLHLKAIKEDKIFFLKDGKHRAVAMIDKEGLKVFGKRKEE